MNNQTFPPKNERLSLKEPTGWFAAGDAFRKALASLSDGAFKLFAYLCFEADRRTGRFQATHKELAAALGKSKRAIGTYVDELRANSMCTVKPGRNQFERSQFEIADSYWPYRRAEPRTHPSEQRDYVASVRGFFLALGCVESSFDAANEALARDMQAQAIPLAVLEQAMLTAACRKYNSWIEGRATGPIRSLAYFKDVVAEILENPLPPGYDGYLRKKVEQLAGVWNELATAGTVGSSISGGN